MNSHSGDGRLWRRYAALAAALFAFVANAANAQTPEARCEKVLPLKALIAAAGSGFTAYDAVERKPGEIECSWMNRSGGSIRTLVVTHWNKAALANWGSNYTPAKTGNDWWDQVVSNTEDAMKAKRQPIAGLGKRAALVAMPPKSGGNQVKVFIQRDNDVVDVIGMGISNADLTKVARAVAAP